jgi:hypothetical protein
MLHHYQISVLLFLIDVVGDLIRKKYIINLHSNFFMADFICLRKKGLASSKDKLHIRCTKFVTIKGVWHNAMSLSNHCLLGISTFNAATFQILRKRTQKFKWVTNFELSSFLRLFFTSDEHRRNGRYHLHKNHRKSLKNVFFPNNGDEFPFEI